MRRILAAVLVAMLLIAGCGGDDGADDADDSPGSLSVGMTDFEFDPAEVSVPAGAEVTVELRNTGSLTHQWVILEAGAEVTTEDELSDEDEILGAESTYWGGELRAGEGDVFTFTAPAAGNYQVVCAIAGHFSAGMEGVLTVTDG